MFSEKTDVLHLPHQSMVAISVMKLWAWKLGQGHQNLISYLSGPIYTGLQIWLTFHPIVHERTCKHFWLKFGGLSLAVTLKNLFSFLSCPNVISMQIWLKSASWLMRYCAHKHILAQIWQFKQWLWNVHANLIEICQPVHKIWCTQALFGLNLAV